MPTLGTLTLFLTRYISVALRLNVSALIGP